MGEGSRSSLAGSKGSEGERAIMRYDNGYNEVQ